MSGHPPQRRQANVGSILLTQQENECLFNHLGRKCIVSFFPIKLLYDSRLRNKLIELTCTVFPVLSREIRLAVRCKRCVCGLHLYVVISEVTCVFSLGNIYFKLKRFGFVLTAGRRRGRAGSERPVWDGDIRASFSPAPGLRWYAFNLKLDTPEITQEKPEIPLSSSRNALSLAAAEWS